MPKHNKKRNTAFLYEILVREVIKSTLNKDVERRDLTISILKESFCSGSALRREIDLYKTLLETANLKPHLGEKLIQETKRAYRQIDDKEIFNEQSSLISKINKKLSAGTFSNFVPNYKDLATLSQIFGENVKVKKRIFLEEKFLKRLTSAQILSEGQKDKVTKLVMKTFIGKFNKTYTALLSEQKDLLNKYVLSFMDNGTEFKFYLNEEIGRLKGALTTSLKIKEIKEDSLMSEKMQKIVDYLEESKEQPVDRLLLQQLLKIQHLITEIKIDDN
tara:strand:+ start:174 stop:998 length:825 start_codon:yes stop_codon:yes gene_type:complete